MGFEIANIDTQNVLALLHSSGGAPLSPFESELLICEAVGLEDTQFADKLRRVAVRLQKGTEVKFVRDQRSAENDPFWVRVEFEGSLLGFIPMGINEIIARLLLAGKSVYGRISSSKITYTGANIKIDIFLKI